MFLFGILGAFLAYLVVWNSILWVLLDVFGKLVGVLGFWLVYFDYWFSFVYLVSVWCTWLAYMVSLSCYI